MVPLQSLIYEGKSMQDELRLQEYNTLPLSIVLLNLRLQEGSPRPSYQKGAGGVFGSSLPKGT